MNKQTKHPSLFDQALAIAINEGKAESSKDADPLQSGVVGENYLLFSKQRKLLISIPLGKLKRNTRKVSNTGNGNNGCLAQSLNFLLHTLVFFTFYLGISAPLAMFLIRSMPTEIKESTSKQASYFRTLSGFTLPFTVGPTAVLLTYFVLKKKK